MSRILGYGAIAVGLLLVVFVAGDVSLRSSTCVACHSREGQYAEWMKAKLTAEKKGFSHEMIACADCHIEGAPQGTLQGKLRGLRHALSNAVAQIDPRPEQTAGLFFRTRIPTENCQFCHLGSLKRKTVKTKDLPESLKGIGLAMDHRKHVIARDDTCAKCHEKYKAPGTAPDKAVTFTEVNHMACDSCHSMASHSYRAGRLLRMTDREFTLARAESWDRLSGNPRWMVPIPTEASCRRCHNGKIHFKSKIFEANCRNGKIFEDCVKCHPGMTKEYFDKYRRERSITAETQGKLSDARPIPSDAMGKHSNHAVE